MTPLSAVSGTALDPVYRRHVFNVKARILKSSRKCSGMLAENENSKRLSGFTNRILLCESYWNKWVKWVERFFGQYMESKTFYLPLLVWRCSIQVRMKSIRWWQVISNHDFGQKLWINVAWSLGFKEMNWDSFIVHFFSFVIFLTKKELRLGMIIIIHCQHKEDH